MTMPITIPAIAPGPRPEPLVEDDLLTDRGEWVAAASDTDEDCFDVVAAGRKVLDVAGVAKVDV